MTVIELPADPTQIPWERAGRDQRTVRTDLPTSEPGVVLRISTLHDRDRKHYWSIVGGVRKMPDDGPFRVEKSSPMHFVQVHTEPTPRFHPGRIVTTHQRAVAKVAAALIVDPEQFAEVLAAVPGERE
jgi:hypothetical protein